MTQQLPHYREPALRADAASNRDRILDAARGLFAERGLDVPMRAVATAAHVGPATLYRRFPTKQDLVTAAFAQETRSCAAIVGDGCADPDPWRGFCSVVERVLELNVGNQGFVDAYLAMDSDAASDADAFAGHRASMLRQLTALARRAQVAGDLRRDFVIDDLVLVLLSGRGLSATPRDRRAAAARRLAALAIEAFRAADTNGPLPRPVRLAAATLRGGR